MRNALRILLAGALLLSAPAVAGAAGARLASLPVAGAAPVRAPFAFDLVGARWKGTGTVELRSRSERGAVDGLDGARALRGRAARERRLRGRAHLDGGGGRIVQLRASPAIHGLRAIFVNGSNGPRARAQLAPANVASAPVIHTRAEWGADESMRRANPLFATSVHMVFVHHTDTSNDYTESQVPSILRSIYTYHVRANGWNDIGYNYLVDRFGQIWEGRYGGITRNVIGAQTLGFNTGSVGIAYIGDGQSTALTDAARAALVSLISWRLDLAHVDPALDDADGLGREPEVRGGHAGDVAGRVGASRRDAHRLPRQHDLRAASRDRRGRVRERPAEDLRAAGGRAQLVPRALRRDALDVALVDGPGARRRRHARSRADPAPVRASPGRGTAARARGPPSRRASRRAGASRRRTRPATARCPRPAACSARPSRW